MKRKIITILTTISFLVLLGSQNVLAKETEINYEDYIKVTNIDTQKEVDIEIKDVITTTSPTESGLLKSNISNAFTKEVEIKFNIPEIETIKSRSYDDASKNHGDFVAYLRFDYETAGTTSVPKIKVTSVRGSWRCTSSSYSARFENREVIARQGNWLSHGALVKNPTSDSFNYSTGWGFTDNIPKTDYSGVWVFSSAKAIISGMGGGYTLEIQL